MKTEQTIIDLVENDSTLQATLQALVDAKYLLPGVFDPRAYLINDIQTESRWKSRRRRTLAKIDWIAIGVALHNQFFLDVYASVAAGEEPGPSRQTARRLESWEEEAAEVLDDFALIRDMVQKLGQYLEYRNRKSQGF